MTDNCPFGNEDCSSTEGMLSGELPCFECWNNAPINAYESFRLIDEMGTAYGIP